jgi:hypothetical protein
MLWQYIYTLRENTKLYVQSSYMSMDNHIIQIGFQCFCGSSSVGFEEASEDDCSTNCNGDQTEKCGGFYRLSIYNISYGKNM